jgi:glycosyltransferase involved in cell wall biosynthesis
VGPLVSVIVPVRNGQRYLEEALESVAAQDYAPVEIVVCDDGSEDESPRIAARYASRLIRRQARGGVAAARNEAIQAARGSILACLDQDDRWEPALLRAHVHALSTRSDALSVVWERVYVEPGCRTPSWFGRPELLAHPHPAFVPSGVAFTVETFRHVGPFDEQFLYSSDLDWFARARAAGAPVHITPQVLLHRRLHDENESRHARVRLEMVMAVHGSLVARHRREGSP